MKNAFPQLALVFVGTVFVLNAHSTSSAADPAGQGRANYSRPFEPPTRPGFLPLPPGAVAQARALMRGPPDELLARIEAEVKIFGERFHSPEAMAAFAAFFARKR